MPEGRLPGRSAWPIVLLACACAILAACASATPPSVPPGRLFPDLRTPVALQSFAKETSVRLTWAAVPGAAGYRIYWRSTSGDDGSSDVLRETHFDHEGLDTGATYSYRLTAVTTDGEESGALASIDDIPFRYEEQHLPGYLAVMPRLHDTFATLAERYLGDSGAGWRIQDFNELLRVKPFEPLLIPLKPYEHGGLFPNRYKTVPVLLYHDITLGEPGPMAVSREQFALQMAYLARNRYRVITLDQLLDFLQFKGSVPDRAVVITFDDGWASTYRIAYPILRRHGFKASLFVYSGLIGNSRKALAWSQLRELAESGVFDIECHTQSHESLLRGDGEALRDYVARIERELEAPRRELARRVGAYCRFLAYPYGKTNHLVVALAREHGYRAAFTADRGENPFFVNDFRLFRSAVYGKYDLKRFAADLSTFDDVVLK